MGVNQLDTRISNPAASGWKRWSIVIGATFVLAVTAGGRFMVGLVFDQIRDGFSLSHSTLGLIVSLNVLIVGAAQPLVGWLVDRIPARAVAAVGLVLVAAGMMLTAEAHSTLLLVIGYGIVVALGFGAISPVTITPLVTGWFERRRATALSIVGMGSPLGQLAIVPALAVLVGTVGWRDGYFIVAAVLLGVGAPLILWLLREREQTVEEDEPVSGCSLGSAARAVSFWQLGVGFFVCGFTMAWVMTYFFDYAKMNSIDNGLAAFALSMMGGISIVGTLVTGWWSDRSGGTMPLSLVYLLRGVGFLMLFLAKTNPALVLVAMAVIGFSWSSTTPLTQALCANIYGRRSLGAIFGLMYAIMPLGNAIGAATTGFLFDQTGSYVPSLLINVAAGTIAALAVMRVRRTPIFSQIRTRETAHALAD
jgi:predicted MFS family arabinose efflux permease